MPISIKNEATERLAHQMARETGESLIEAIHSSFPERWDRLMQQRPGSVLASQIAELLGRVDALPVLDLRPEDEILGYCDPHLCGSFEDSGLD